MRLIDADAVIKEQRRIMEELYGGSIEVLKKHMDIDDDLSVPIHGLEGYSRVKQFFYGLKGVLEAAQTVSATPAVHGRWISWEEAGNCVPSPDRHECSICHDSAQVLVNGFELLSDYCPNCGAKMDGARM